MNRCRAFAALTFLAAVAGCCVAANAQQATALRVGAAPIEGNGDLFYAKELGYFARAGLDVDVQATFGGGAAAASALNGGDLEVAASNVISVANARLRNLPFVIIASSGMVDSDGTAALIAVAPDGPIQTAKDLNGKIVCGSSPGSLDQVGIDSWIDKHGGDAQSIKYVELAQSERVVALQQGRVAACTMTNPVLENALASRGIRTIGKVFDGIAPRFVATVMIARRDWALAHRDVVQRFASALLGANAWATAHPEQAAVILEKYTKIREDRVVPRPPPSLDPKFVQPLLDAAARYKVIPRPMDARELLL